MSDRQYQEVFKHDVYNAWNAGYQNVCGVMPTGAGKSFTVGEIIREMDCNSVAIAHRQELVGQLSLALANQGVHHHIITQPKIRNFIMSQHLKEFDHCFVDANARTAVIGVDTLIRQADRHDRFLKSVNLWVVDECHHLQKKNKWGKAVALMPNARGLGVTATPIRADGRGLGRHNDGLLDVIVEGPSMRELIQLGFLTDYRIFAPPSDVDYTRVEVSSTGDFKDHQLKAAVQESHLVGDVVDHYLRIAPGKLGVTFATDVETATEIAQQFNARGVPAEVVSAKTPDKERAAIIGRFRAGELRQLVNVDLFGEGFDLPAIEVVSMARRTLSYSLYSQQFGRSLRPLPGKGNAIIIDHAGNVAIHGLPDKERIWSLDSREKRPACKNPEDDIPLRYCVVCTQPYERIHTNCPHCGHYPEPEGRSKPEQVDGDLLELTPDVLAKMREQLELFDESPEAVANRMRYAGAPAVAYNSALQNLKNRREIQTALRESIAWFAHVQRTRGVDDHHSYRTFYHLFGIDVMNAQMLGKPEALELANRINKYLGEAA